MGHEYVEMKNTSAAVGAYRQAVDIDRRDYRAWNGLGQAYEMMGKPFWALHYFKESVFYQPNDSRLSIAMAQCYENDQIHMLDEAIKCYRRASNCNDGEATAMHQLGKLHSELGHHEEAAFYYKKDLERMESEERNCNIPPDSIGILPVDRVRGIKLRKSKLMEIFYDMSAFYGISIRVVFNTFKARVKW
jgi:anaphase-promoting complex subunit 8